MFITMNTKPSLLSLITLQCCFVIVGIITTKAQQTIKPQQKTIAEVYEEIPVVLFEAPEEVVSRLQGEFTPRPFMTSKYITASLTFHHHIKNHPEKNLFLLLKSDSTIAELSKHCNDCATYLSFYKEVSNYAQSTQNRTDIGKVYIAVRQSTGKPPELIGTVSIPLPAQAPFANKTTIIKTLTALSLTNGTLGAQELRQLSTTTADKKESDHLSLAGGTIQNVEYQTLYDYLVAYIRNPHHLYNVPELLRAVVLRKLDGTIDGITGLEFYQQPEIRTGVLLYEAPKEIFQQFYDTFTPALLTTSKGNNAEKNFPKSEEITKLLNLGKPVPESLVVAALRDRQTESMVKTQPTVQKVFIVTADVSQGGMPDVLGSWALGTSGLHEPYVFSAKPPFPVIHVGTLETEQLKAAKAGTNGFGMDELLRNVLRDKTYKKVYKATLINYVPGVYSAKHVVDVEELPIK